MCLRYRQHIDHWCTDLHSETALLTSVLNSSRPVTGAAVEWLTAVRDAWHIVRMSKMMYIPVNLKCLSLFSSLICSDTRSRTDGMSVTVMWLLSVAVYIYDHVRCSEIYTDIDGYLNSLEYFNYVSKVDVVVVLHFRVRVDWCKYAQWFYDQKNNCLFAD